MPTSLDRPRIRPVEVFPVEEEGRQMLLVHDPAGYAAGAMTISEPGLYILSLCDGERGLDAIRTEFAKKFGQVLPLDQLESMVEQLEAARFLDSPGFAKYFDGLVTEYHDGLTRESGPVESFGADGEGLTAFLDDILEDATRASATSSKRLAGLIAPHLDYPRGQPCYAAAYNTLRLTGPAERFVILGTNHFGRATGPVATRKDFQTPLGATRTDRMFIERLAERAVGDLYVHEFDHRREHSVELQVLLLQHLFGADAFEIVPILCHDPCGPNGTGSYDGEGIDLKVFADALGELIREDDKSTIVIAGADLSHVGARFGDERELDDEFLAEIAAQDARALHQVHANNAESFADIIRERDNTTRICSVGCIYALMTALPTATCEPLHYHQAADPPTGTGVTCTAAAFWE